MIRSIFLATTLVATASLAQESAPAAQPQTTTTTAPAQPETKAEAPAQPETKAEAPKAVTESIGDGTIGLLLQGWFQATTDSAFSAGLANSTLSRSGQINSGSSTFRVRRAEMSYDGKLLKGLIKYRAMIDGAQINNGPLTVKSAVNGTSATGTVSVANLLGDASVSILPIPQLEVKIGQFKIPLTGEGFGSSGKLDFAERAIVTRTLGDQRELGVMLATDKIDAVEAQLAVVNGTGKNTLDNGPTKDVIGRVAFHPVKGITIGGSGAVGKTLGTDSKTYRLKNRLGAELSAEYAGATLKGEIMGGRDEQPDAAYIRKPLGWYVTAGYRFGPAQLIGRYERWDSDTDSSAADCSADVSGTTRGPLAEGNRCVKAKALTVGVNYDFAPAVLHAAKLQLNYVYGTDESHNVSASELIVNTQVKF